MQLPLNVDELQQAVIFWSIRIALAVVVAGIVWLALVKLSDGGGSALARRASCRPGENRLRKSLR